MGTLHSLGFTGNPAETFGFWAEPKVSEPRNCAGQDVGLFGGARHHLHVEKGVLVDRRETPRDTHFRVL